MVQLPFSLAFIPDSFFVIELFTLAGVSLGDVAAKGRRRSELFVTDSALKHTLIVLVCLLFGFRRTLACCLFSSVCGFVNFLRLYLGYMVAMCVRAQKVRQFSAKLVRIRIWQHIQVRYHCLVGNSHIRIVVEGL